MHSPFGRRKQHVGEEILHTGENKMQFYNFCVDNLVQLNQVIQPVSMPF